MNFSLISFLLSNETHLLAVIPILCFSGVRRIATMGSEWSEEEIEIYEPLNRCSVLSYGVGHMLNDMTSSCWFTYLLLFLTEIGLSPR